ncbi:M48 family metallopeptidase [Mogibacterium pumilum]|uniref:YgjP-like metallopeptidase domain-containing protein n=1 Tax=Mogibacterium pumilum TaxID=86332 RepID=A0A223AS31_9FIRM|nr:SprT family zinc-dependent metalloprotease [Mogibacterium pumilum]ASS37780.1 hypothetical protein AXF17_04495 [Mogibacterium pumilum]
MRSEIRTETHVVSIAGETLVYTLERKNVRNINLRIRPDASICVSAPRRVPLAEIEEFMISKGAFVINALARIKGDKADKSRYDDGDKAYFLGRPLDVKLLQRPRVCVSIEGDLLLVQMPEATNAAARIDVVKRWYSKQASEIFMSVVHEVYDEFRRTYRVPFPHVTIRQMKSRWGSCRPDLGKITLNLLLVTASYEELRYVIVHEFAHFIEANHSEAFWCIVSRFEPCYKERRHSLRNLPTKW